MQISVNNSEFISLNDICFIPKTDTVQKIGRLYQCCQKYWLSLNLPSVSICCQQAYCFKLRPIGVFLKTFTTVVLKIGWNVHIFFWDNIRKSKQLCIFLAFFGEKTALLLWHSCQSQNFFANFFVAPGIALKKNWR